MHELNCSSHNAMKHICCASKGHTTAIYSSCINTAIVVCFTMWELVSQSADQMRGAIVRGQNKSKCNSDREKAKRVPKHWTHPSHTSYGSRLPSPSTFRIRYTCENRLSHQKINAFIACIYWSCCCTNCNQLIVYALYRRSCVCAYALCSAWCALSFRLCVCVCFVLFCIRIFPSVLVVC